MSWVGQPDFIVLMKIWINTSRTFQVLTVIIKSYLKLCTWIFCSSSFMWLSEMFSVHHFFGFIIYLCWFGFSAMRSSAFKERNLFLIKMLHKLFFSKRDTSKCKTLFFNVSKWYSCFYFFTSKIDAK